MKTALITGITGQDGSYLADLLLAKGYRVHGLKRRTSLSNLGRIELLLPDLVLHDGDLCDGSSLSRIVDRVAPDEVYNLGAVSHVAVSFHEPEHTGLVDALGPLKLLEALRGSSARFYQAASSELYGKVIETPQTETTPFYPRSPYAIAKLYAYWATVNYRESYGMHASNGILFNHESPRRGEDFVTRKITLGLARVKAGQLDTLKLGNLDAKRDWGHARDYVEAQWLMLQQERPDDYVIATGEQHSVREFVDAAAFVMGMPLEWVGTGVDEKAYQPGGDIPIVAVDPAFFRPAEVDTLLGDASKARRILGWKPHIDFLSLVSEMAESDLALVNRG